MTKEEVVLLQKNKQLVLDIANSTYDRIRATVLQTDKTSVLIPMYADEKLTMLVHNQLLSKGFSIDTKTNHVSWE